MPYRAPLSEYRFLLEHVVGYPAVAATERFAHADLETAVAILNEAGKLAEEVLAPLRRAGDLAPARLENGVVRTPPGYRDAYQAIAAGGWVGASAPEEFGGMGLPQALTACVHEMMSGACLALQLNPLLTQGQIEALAEHADPAIQATYIPKLASGAWSGTMNLTEPQAGSDVGALRTRAEPAGDGSYRITGEKIYITWGDGDVAENISHLVLARLPDAPPGSRGISLFVVPKLLPGPDGAPGERNALRVVGLEKKLGLHGSPTATMSYEGATGWMIGAPNAGLAAMFTMMNNARLLTGVQGVGIAEAAHQAAVAFAADRRQGRTGGGRGTIDEHPDVRRMLLTMEAEVTAARATLLSCAAAIDQGVATGDPAWRARAAFLTPVAKTMGAETGHHVSHEAIQVHGGLGFIEDTGIAQLARDVRVVSIYEGTSGIQAADLVMRKLADGGEAAEALLDEVSRTAKAARSRFPDLAQAVWTAAESLREVTDWLVQDAEAEDRLAGSLAYLRAFAKVFGARHHLAAAIAEPAVGRRAALAGVYVTRVLPRHAADLAEARAGAGDLAALAPQAMPA